MAKQTINIGASANDGTGDPLRTAFDKVNSNFTELYNDDAGDVNSVNAGTGISVDQTTGAVTVTNTAPDQTVSLTEGTGIDITGTYPNFTIASTVSGIDGSGTTNYVPKWTDGDTIGNSVIYDNGTNVGIGTSSPSTKLHIRGDGSLIRLENNNSDLNGTFIDFRDSTGQRTGYLGTVNSSDAMNFLATNSVPMIFSTNNSERMRITSGGNLLVGGSVDYSRISVTNGNSARTGITLSDGNTASLMLFAGNSSDAVIAIDTQNLSFKTGATAGQDNGTERMRLQSNGDLHVDGDVIAYSTTISDQRLKDDIQTIDNALDKVSNLRGVSYTWNNGNRKGQKDLGLIAQEVEQVLPELVREKEMPMIDGGTYKTVDYEKIVGVLIEAVKELKQEIEILKAK